MAVESKIRSLHADEIECRVGSIGEKGISLLLYKNARVDQAILDEVFGIYGWQRSHMMIGNSLYCTVSIWDPEKKTWISKQDVGTTGDFEKEKSAASDSFKRACVNLGIGRELYTAPFIFIPASKVNIINLRLDITHLYYPAKNSFQKGRLKRREIFTELLLYTLTT